LTLPTDDYDADQWQRLTELMPLQRLSSPEDIAEAVLLLTTARAITGETLFVDAEPISRLTPATSSTSRGKFLSYGPAMR
jgi:hypothetical protein